ARAVRAPDRSSVAAAVAMRKPFAFMSPPRGLDGASMPGERSMFRSARLECIRRRPRADGQGADREEDRESEEQARRSAVMPAAPRSEPPQEREHSSASVAATRTPPRVPRPRCGPRPPPYSDFDAVDRTLDTDLGDRRHMALRCGRLTR